LLSITNPAGATWSLTYDASNRVSSVSDPFVRPTTFSYSATSGKISSIADC
jgi:YD repeat-containing protein